MCSSTANNNNVTHINVKSNKHLSCFSGAVLLLTAAFGVTGCNEKSDPTSDPFISTTNVAVTAFSLNSDSKVMENLDSVFFSIDLEHGVIFNADSLPVGTKINKLVPNIKYSDYVTKATIKMEGGDTREGEVNYLTSPTDSIDFTGNVTLTLFTEYGEHTKDYRIKVNVHKEEADSLVWGDAAISSLPSRLDNPKNQKTIDFNGQAISLIEESDGSYTYATSDNLYEKLWQKEEITFPFTPDVRSMCATTRAICILSTDGQMYETTDGSNWTDTGEKWTAMLGAYLDTAIGLKAGANGLEYAQYPLKDLLCTPADPDFPVAGFSNFVILANKWTSSPVGFFVGGKMADGTLTSVTWAFDGANWIKLCEGGMPPVTGASIIPYYSYRNTVSTWTRTEFPVWMIVGGRLSDGSLNRTVFISYDNGVNWGQGNEKLQLPEEIPTMTDCDNVVMTTPRKALISNYWKKSGKGPRRISVEIDGDNILWDCPYIYLIGGVNPNGELCNTIWRGALARLTFTPLF